MRLLVLLAVAALVGCANPDIPSVQANPLADTRDSIGPYSVSVVVVENRGIAAVRLFYRASTAPQAAQTELTQVADGRYAGSIPGYPIGTTIHWLVEAEDIDGNIGYDPPEAEFGDSGCVADLGPEDPVPPDGAAFCFSVLR